MSNIFPRLSFMLKILARRVDDSYNSSNYLSSYNIYSDKFMSYPKLKSYLLVIEKRLNIVKRFYLYH